MRKEKTLIVDIDGTILNQKGPGTYHEAKPLPGALEAISLLYEKYNIIFYTARNNKWKELTLKQLKEFGFKYDKLVMDKPAGEYYIDDRALRFEGSWNEITTQIEK